LGIIRILDEAVSNMIAAGEVVDNPAGMVKELLENALDAGSKKILLDIRQGGRTLTIRDDGRGMVRDDLLLSVERHATSKISAKEDLFRLTSYGFRGEALSSVAAVSKMTLSSRAEEDPVGHRITVSGGKITSLNEFAMNRGTTIEVRELFFNTPARLKFLRKAATEYANIKDILIREALANPDVAISLALDGRKALETSGRGLDNAIAELFSPDALKNSCSFSLGRLGNRELYKSGRDAMFLFVNGRPVRSKLLEDAVLQGYYTKLMKGQYPFVILDLRLDPALVDVNVHPSKKIVKFSNESNIFRDVAREVREAIAGNEDFFVMTPNPWSAAPGEILESGESAAAERPVWPTLRTESPPMVFEPASSGFETGESSGPADFFRESYFADSGAAEPPIKADRENHAGQTPAPEKKTTPGPWTPFRVIGQLLRTYILVERGGNLEIYDQHVVNERIRYESLKTQYYGRSIEKQLLLTPLALPVDPRDKQLIADNREIFSAFGFDFEERGEHEIAILAVPTFEFRDSVADVFREILQNIKDGKDVDIRENILISMACRGSVKANERLTNEEMTDIIRRLHEIGKYTCPHGRPIFIRISEDDLEKRFGRK